MEYEAASVHPTPQRDVETYNHVITLAGHRRTLTVDLLLYESKLSGNLAL